jgi:hydroxyacylglutathione hydrolase
VRRAAEWQAAHIEVAMHHPLDGFRAKLPDLKPGETVMVICKSGYRSAIACSLLQRAGFKNVSNVIGGFDAWRGAGLPFLTEETVAA